MYKIISSQNLSIGSKVAMIRRVRGFTQEEVSKRLSVSFQTLSRIEMSNSIKEDRLQQLAEVLDVSVDAIKNFKEEHIFKTDVSTRTNLNASINKSFGENLNSENLVGVIIELYELLLTKERKKSDGLQRELSLLKKRS